MRKKDFSNVSERVGEAARLTSARAPEDRRVAHLRSVQAQIEAIGRGDPSAALENAHDDVDLEIFAPPEFKWIRRARGVGPLRAAIAHNFDSLEDQRPEITNVVTEGDNVVLFGRERGLIRETGQRYDVQFVQKFGFVDGRLASVRIVAARSEAPLADNS